MDTPNYLGLVGSALDRFEALQVERDNIDAEMAKLERFITATANLLPDDQRELVLKRLDVTNALQSIRDSGLTDAVKTILMNYTDWHTAAQVRDRLVAAGFNFSLYQTNPLASVSTTLRRLKSEEIETHVNADGVMVFRWHDTEMAAKAAAIKRAREAKKTRGLPPPPKDWPLPIQKFEKK